MLNLQSCFESGTCDRFHQHWLQQSSDPFLIGQQKSSSIISNFCKADPVWIQPTAFKSHKSRLASIRFYTSTNFTVIIFTIPRSCASSDEQMAGPSFHVAILWRQGGSTLTDPRGLDHLPRAASKVAEGSPHALLTFSEHLTAALSTGLHSRHCPHHAAGPLRAALTGFEPCRALTGGDGIVKISPGAAASCHSHEFGTIGHWTQWRAWVRKSEHKAVS